MQYSSCDLVPFHSDTKRYELARIAHKLAYAVTNYESAMLLTVCVIYVKFTLALTTETDGSARGVTHNKTYIQRKNI